MLYACQCFRACMIECFDSFRCLLDTDDEVRDRATLYVQILHQKQKALNSAYILNGKPALEYQLSFDKFKSYIFSYQVKIHQNPLPLTGCI